MALQHESLKSGTTEFRIFSDDTIYRITLSGSNIPGSMEEKHEFLDRKPDGKNDPNKFLKSLYPDWHPLRRPFDFAQGFARQGPPSSRIFNAYPRLSSYQFLSYLVSTVGGIFWEARRILPRPPVLPLLLWPSQCDRSFSSIH